MGVSSRILFARRARRSTTAILLLLILAPFVPTGWAQQTGSPQQVADQDCEKIKEEIKALQDEIANISAQMLRMQRDLDEINKAIATLQQGVKFFSGPGFSETARGEALDQLAKAMNYRRRVEQDIEDAANHIGELKNLIAHLLDLLANCPPPSTTEPPKQETPTQPPSTPPGTKTVSSAPAPCTFLASLSGGITTAGNLSTTSAMEGDFGMYCGPAGLGLGFVRSSDATVQGTTTGSSLPPTPATANFHAAEFKGSVNVLDLGPLSMYVQGGGWAFTARSTSTTTIVVTSPTGGTMTEMVTTTTSRGGVAPFFGGSIQGRLTNYLAAQVGIKRGYLRSGNSLDQGATMLLFGLSVSPQFPRALLHLGPK